MAEENSILKVNIYGTDYPIRGSTDDSAYVERVASIVDRKMREVDQSISVKSSLKVAILAALNITDELLREQSVRHDTVQEYEKRVRSLSESLDTVLDSSE